MAQVNSLRDGYINETGVMSAAITTNTSALIKHFVMLQSNISIKDVAFTSASNRPGINGTFAVGSRRATLTLGTASSPVRICSVGAVEQISGSPSIPLGTTSG